jgi:hypothetical protein
MEGSRSPEILWRGRANLAWRTGAPRPGGRIAIWLEFDKGPIRTFLDDKRAAAIMCITIGFADIQEFIGLYWRVRALSQQIDLLDTLVDAMESVVALGRAGGRQNPAGLGGQQPDRHGAGLVPAWSSKEAKSAVVGPSQTFEKRQLRLDCDPTSRETYL